MTRHHPSNEPAVHPHVEYDPFSLHAHLDPYPLYAALREHARVYRNPELDFWALSRFADVEQAARDWETFSSAPSNDIDGTGDYFGDGNLIDLDPPAHDVLRNAVRGWFTPKAVHALEERTSRTVRAFLDRLDGEPRVDLAQGFAWPLHLELASELLDVPAEDRAELGRLYALALERVVGSATIPHAALDAAAQAKGYFREHLRSAHAPDSAGPMRGILDALRAQEISEDEATGLAFTIWASALDTPATFLSNALDLLARHPDQRDQLIASPDTLPAAIEELARFEPPEHNVMRTATRACEIAGQALPAGARVLLIVASANRDPRRFERPDDLDVRRESRRSLAFGVGPHFCLGAPMARTTARIALAGLLERFPRYAIVGSSKRLTKQSSWGFAELSAQLR